MWWFCVTSTLISSTSRGMFTHVRIVDNVFCGTHYFCTNIFCVCVYVHRFWREKTKMQGICHIIGFTVRKDRGMWSCWQDPQSEKKRFWHSGSGFGQSPVLAGLKELWVLSTVITDWEIIMMSKPSDLQFRVQQLEKYQGYRASFNLFVLFFPFVWIVQKWSAEISLSLSVSPSPPSSLALLARCCFNWCGMWPGK